MKMIKIYNSRFIKCIENIVFSLLTDTGYTIWLKYSFTQL